MKKLAKFSVAILCLASLTSLANAATPGVYAGAGIGWTKQNTPDIKKQFPEIVGVEGVNVSQDFTGVGGKAFVGYNFNKYVGIEGGFSHYAPADYKVSIPAFASSTSANVSMNAVNLVGKAYLPIAETGINAYALGGAAYVRSTVEGKQIVDNVQQPKQSQTTNRIRPVYGVGVSYDIPNSPVTTSLEYSHVQGLGDMMKDEKAIPAAHMVTLNLSYNFGN